MKTGDYVRTGISGLNIQRIGKIKEIISEYFIHTDIGTYDKENIINFSPNIIDLIEVGDYVNGYMVENIDAGLNGDIIEIATGTNYFQSPSLYNEDIKSIVTKEQFESMEYKIRG